MTLNKGNGKKRKEKRFPKGICGKTVVKALFLSKWLATFDFLKVLWGPNAGTNPFCRRNRRRRALVEACSTPDSILRDTWFSPHLMPRQEGPPWDTDTQTGGQSPGALPAPYYLRQEAKTTRIPMAFIPEDTRRSEAPRSHLSLLMRGLPAELLKMTKMRRGHAGAKPQSQRRAQSKRIFFKPNYLWIWYPFWYLDLNIKIRRAQLSEKCKCFFSFSGNIIPSSLSFFFFFWGVSISSCFQV